MGRTRAHADYLIKPISPSELLEAILLALGQEPEQAPSSRVMDPPRQDRRRLGILVAEDNVVNQLLMRRLIEKIGDEVLVASDGRDTVAMLADHPFDLVFMDVQMPHMDGLEATGEIRRHEASRALPGCPSSPSPRAP